MTWLYQLSCLDWQLKLALLVICVIVFLVARSMGYANGRYDMVNEVFSKSLNNDNE